MKAIGILLVCVVALGSSACLSARLSKSSQANANAAPDASIEVSPAEDDSSESDPCSKMFSNVFVAMESLSYEGYEVVRRRSSTYDKESKSAANDSYAVLMAGGREVLRFDGVHHGLGAATGFGFANLLGADSRQLVVSQTAPRTGRHWAVNLANQADVIFDSGDWDLGREDVCIHDFDNDGVSELMLVDSRFCSVGKMSMSDCPLLQVVFKYDPTARKYFPDKEAFARDLENIDEDVGEIDPSENVDDELAGSYLSQRLDILLRYVFGGREQEG